MKSSKREDETYCDFCFIIIGPKANPVIRGKEIFHRRCYLRLKKLERDDEERRQIRREKSKKNSRDKQRKDRIIFFCLRKEIELSEKALSRCLFEQNCSDFALGINTKEKKERRRERK